VLIWALRGFLQIRWACPSSGWPQDGDADGVLPPGEFFNELLTKGQLQKNGRLNRTELKWATTLNAIARKIDGNPSVDNFAREPQSKSSHRRKLRVNAGPSQWHKNGNNFQLKQFPAISTVPSIKGGPESGKRECRRTLLIWEHSVSWSKPFWT